MRACTLIRPTGEVDDQSRTVGRISAKRASAELHASRYMVQFQRFGKRGLEAELTGQQWHESMMQLLVGANRICAAARHQQPLLITDEIAAFRTVYDALVLEGEVLHPETAQIV